MNDNSNGGTNCGRSAFDCQCPRLPRGEWHEILPLTCGLDRFRPRPFFLNFAMPLNRKRTWTTDEDKRLMELQASGRSYISMAAALKRSQASIEHRLYVLRKRDTKSSIDPDPKQ